MVKTSGYLSGHIIAAIPSSSKDSLENVVAVCKHDEEGAMGFVLNQPLEGISLSDLIEQLSDEDEDLPPISLNDPQVFWGGPVEIGRGFVLHSLDVNFEQTLPVDEEYGITANMAILKAIITGQGAPKEYALFLGYIGWKPGQLEKELSKKWFALPGSKDFIFNVPASHKWDIALKKIGLDKIRFSSSIGKG